MPYKSTRSADDTRCEMTQRLRKGYIRFEPKYVPDVITFLLVAANKYAEQMHGIRRSAVSTSSPYYVAMMERNRVAQNVMQELIDLAGDKWDKAHWNQALAQIETAIAENNFDAGDAPIRDAAIITSQRNGDM